MWTVMAVAVARARCTCCSESVSYKHPCTPAEQPPRRQDSYSRMGMLLAAWGGYGRVVMLLAHCERLLVRRCLVVLQLRMYHSAATQVSHTICS